MLSAANKLPSGCVTPEIAIVRFRLDVRNNQPPTWAFWKARIALPVKRDGNRVTPYSVEQTFPLGTSKTALREAFAKLPAWARAYATFGLYWADGAPRETYAKETVTADGQRQAGAKAWREEVGLFSHPCVTPDATATVGEALVCRRNANAPE